MRLRYDMRKTFLTLLTLLVLPFVPQLSSAQTVSIANTNWFFSPYNWNLVTTPNLIRLDPISGVSITGNMVTTQPGAYFTLRFTNSRTAVLNLDMDNMTSSGGMTSMAVQWSVDNTLSPVHTLSLSDTQLPLAANLDAGTHTIQFWVVSSDYHQDRWTSTTNLKTGAIAPTQALRITGMTLEPSAIMSTPTTLRPKRILFYGDSIAEGAAITPADDAGQTYAVTCARLLNAEYGVIANPGQGWAANIAPTSGVPVFGNAFAQYYGQTPSLPLVKGIQAPDYVILNMGTNDAIAGALPGDVTLAALTWLQRMRLYFPNSQVFLLVPFGGFEAAALQSAFNQYTLANPSDTNVRLLNLGATAQTGLMGQVPGGSAQSFDGIHPDAATHRALGYQLTAAIQTALGRNDFSGDGKSDLILQNVTSNQIANWFQNNTIVQNGAFVPSVPDSAYQVVGSADLNADGKPDYVFQNRLTGQVAVWYMNGTNVLGGGLVPQVPSAGYKVVAIGDFNGDGKPDLVFQHQTTNQIAFWFMDGTTLLGGSALPQAPSIPYHLVGVGDFNRDGQTDLLFQDMVGGGLVVWYMNGVQFTGGSVVSAPPPPGYRVEAVADFDGDGRPDLALRDTNGNIVLWHLDGAKVYFTEALSLRLDTAFRIAGPR